MRALGAWLVMITTAAAQAVLPQAVLRGEPEQLLQMKFSDAPLQVVLDHYAEITGRTLITSPGVPAVLISLQSKEKLTETEFLMAIESVLHMNQVALVPLGDKFLKVVPTAELGTNAEEIQLGAPDVDRPQTDKLERRIFTLEFLTLEELQPIIDQVKNAYAKVTPLERANSFMIIDTVANLQRLTEIIEFLDRPVVAKAETRIYELQHAQAADIASRLNELVQTSQEAEQTQRTVPRTLAERRARGVIRAGAAARQPTDQPDFQSARDLAERGMIVGDVKIVADERTNILIVISEPANFAFFDKIVTILDRAIEPELAVEVVSLEYADAEEISGILNDFVGAATADQQSQRRRETTQEGDAADARAQALRSFIQQRQAAALRRTSAAETEAMTSGIAQLSENTRILADQRTNSLLLMGRRSDIEILQRVIDQLDVMLAQVMIEAVIVEVQLDNNLQFGIEWLQRSYTAFSEEKIGPGNSIAVREPVIGFGGASDLDGAGPPFIDGGDVTRATQFTPGALTYYATFYDLNLDAILQLAAGSSDAKILSTPVIVTTDNTEANIIVGESRPVVTSTSVTAGGVGRNTFQYQDIGIELSVTPRINPQRFVVMEITQTADNVGGFEVIDGNNVPVITRRELTASIAVENRSSIVLGGLIGSEKRKGRTKIALLGDIPILGSLFRSDEMDQNRTELLVIITPYVMTTPDEVMAETVRLNERSLAHKEWGKTWSDSPIYRMQKDIEEEAPAPLLDPFIEELREQQTVPPDQLQFPPSPLFETAPRPEEASPAPAPAAPAPEPAPPYPPEAPPAEPAEPLPSPAVEENLPPPLSRRPPDGYDSAPARTAPALTREVAAWRQPPPVARILVASPDAPPIDPVIEPTSLALRRRPAMSLRRRPAPQAEEPDWRPVPRPSDDEAPNLFELPAPHPTVPPPREPIAPQPQPRRQIPEPIPPAPESPAPEPETPAPPPEPIRLPETPLPELPAPVTPEETPLSLAPVPVAPPTPEPPSEPPAPAESVAPPAGITVPDTFEDPRRRVDETLSVQPPPSPSRSPARAPVPPPQPPPPPPVSPPPEPPQPAEEPPADEPPPSPPPTMPSEPDDAAPWEPDSSRRSAQRMMDELKSIIGDAPPPPPATPEEPAEGVIRSRPAPRSLPVVPSPTPQRPATVPPAGAGISLPVRPDRAPPTDDTEAVPPLK